MPDKPLSEEERKEVFFVLVDAQDRNREPEKPG
jgi:hypothetical protein